MSMTARGWPEAATLPCAGTAPFPRGCISLAVWESKAYVIANSKDGAMATFRLDLQTWEWALLRQQRPSPSARRSTVAAASPQVYLYS